MTNSKPLGSTSSPTKGLLSVSFQGFLVTVRIWVLSTGEQGEINLQFEYTECRAHRRKVHEQPAEGHPHRPARSSKVRELRHGWGIRMPRSTGWRATLSTMLPSMTVLWRDAHCTLDSWKMDLPLCPLPARINLYKSHRQCISYADRTAHPSYPISYPWPASSITSLGK